MADQTCVVLMFCKGVELGVLQMDDSVDGLVSFSWDNSALRAPTTDFSPVSSL